MTVKDDQFYLMLIAEYIADIERYTAGGKDIFLHDDMVRNATLRQLQVMAGSVGRLSEDTTALVPTIPWRMIRDFRNVLVHNYDGRINYEVVWATIEWDIPPLKAAIMQLLQEGR
jgi:uncharacterized protein with HEPN domain